MRRPKYESDSKKVGEMEAGYGSGDAHSPYCRLICYGDSITEDLRFSMFLQRDAKALEILVANQHLPVKDYLRRLDVINRGFSGYNTDHFTKIYESILPPASDVRVKLVTLFFGANDACLPGQDQHVPVERYSSNLARTASAIVRKLDCKLILVVPPPVNEYTMDASDKANNRTLGGRTAEHTATIAKACRDVYKNLPEGVAENVRLLDLWTIFYDFAALFEKDYTGDALLGSKHRPQSQGLKRLLSDGLHFTDEAYALLRTHMNILISQQWPELDPENMPMVFPPWNEAPKQIISPENS